MNKNINKTAAAFVEWVQELILEKGYVLLKRREYEKAEQLGDKLLGYFDGKGVYFIPDRLFVLAVDFMSTHKTNTVESYHRMVRKFTKSKAIFPHGRFDMQGRLYERSRNFKKVDNACS